MDKNRLFTIGCAAIISGTIALSFEIFGLKVLQCLSYGKGMGDAGIFDYQRDQTVFIAMILTGLVIIFGLVLLGDALKSRQN